jgi:hypothetical protein
MQTYHDSVSNQLLIEEINNNITSTTTTINERLNADAAHITALFNNNSAFDQAFSRNGGADDDDAINFELLESLQEDRDAIELQVLPRLSARLTSGCFQ